MSVPVIVILPVVVSDPLILQVVVSNPLIH